MLYLLGKPAIQILFQHGAFTKHSTALTTQALLGYAIGLPGSIASELLVRSFYSLKDARTPLFTNIGTLAARIGIMLLLVKIMIGPNVILAIPLATSITALAETILLCALLFLGLQKKVKMDKGLERLKRKRARNLKKQAEQLLGEKEALEVEVEIQ